MNKNSHFIIYTHHNHTLPVALPKKKRGRGSLRLLKKIGSFLAFPFIKLGSAVVFEFDMTVESLDRRFARAHMPLLAKNFAVFVAVCLMVLGAFQSAAVVNWALRLKQDLLLLTRAGGEHLSDAVAAAKNQDFPGARDEFEKAYETFLLGNRQMTAGSALLNDLSNAIPQKRSAQNLTAAAGLVSQAGASMADFAQNMQSLKLTPQGIVPASASENAAENFSGARQNLQQAVALVTQASELIRGINPNDIPAGYRQKFQDIQGQTGLMLSSLQNLQDVLRVSGSLLLGDKTILLLFENNNELRPAGGFIGTFGVLKMRDGAIRDMRISSIYDLDGQLAERIVPPSPVLNVNNRWYLRDSNWFADFPATAEKVSSFYEKEGGETPDVIMAMTPNLIQDLLAVTGPVELPEYGVTLTPENFAETTQALTGTSEDSPVNAPKQMLAQLVPVMLQKLSALPGDRWPQALLALEKNLNSKQMVFYSRDPELQKTLAEYHWAGEMLNTDRDYLSAVSANLGGTKTDLSVAQEMKLSVQILPDGSVQDEVIITRTNRMPPGEKNGNISFIRVFVPQNSALLSASGFETKDLEPVINKGDKLDADAEAWQKGIGADKQSGTLIGSESGKTFFAGWMELAPGETKTVRLSYRLPFRLDATDHYGLLVQKQIGATPGPFAATISFNGRQTAWKNFQPASESGGSLDVQAPLDEDKFFGIVLQQKK